MVRQSAKRVIERLTQVVEGTSEPTLVSDADGTLWSGDVGVDTFEAMLTRGAVLNAARESLLQEAQRFGLTGSGSPHEQAAQLYDAYHRGAYPERRCFELMAWVFGGSTPDEARRIAQKAVAQRGLSGRLRPEMREVLAWARDRSVDIWIVSASPQWVVEASVALFDIASDRVIGARAAVENGVIQPRLAEPMPLGSGKLEAIRREPAIGTLIGAFGDTEHDFEMLSMAEVPVAVHPSAGLKKRANELPSMVEMRGSV